MVKIISVLLTFFIAGCNLPENKTVPTFEERSIEVKNVTDFLHKHNAIVLDVRTAQEYASGHIDNALNISYVPDSFAIKIQKLDKNKTYLVHCAAGVPNGRSYNAMRILDSLGFKKTLNMKGGFSEWKKFIKINEE